MAKMARLIATLFLLPHASHALLGSLKDKLRSKNLSSKNASELLPPVFATDYLPDNYLEGQSATSVNLDNWDGPTQYSGFFTFTGERDGAAPEINTFFWYLPPLDGNPDAEVLLWLQGGPGGSSLYGMFSEIGPFTINADGEVVARDETTNWNQHYGLLFLDNPCGVGYSFSADESGYVTNETQVGSDLYSAIAQFYQLFPNLRSNDFYITGESYAGKYIPAAAYTIFTRNPTASDDFKIPLRGISIGDGAMDPSVQFQNYGSLLWYMGMIDANERGVFDQYETTIRRQLNSGDNLGAFNTFDEMLNGDFIFPTYYYNVTGLTNYFNMEQGDCGDCQPDYTDAWLDTSETRNLIHVGDLAYDSFNDTVEVYLKNDWMVGVTEFLTPLLNSQSVKVLVYSGQNDVILGAPLTEQFLDKLQWEGKTDFLSAAKETWLVDTVVDDPVAGYVKHVKDFSFTYAVVRGAGHMVPLDQPERAYDLITQFVNSDFDQ